MKLYRVSIILRIREKTLSFVLVVVLVLESKVLYYVHTILDSFCASTQITPEMASVHKYKR